MLAACAFRAFNALDRTPSLPTSMFEEIVGGRTGCTIDSSATESAKVRRSRSKTSLKDILMSGWLSLFWEEGNGEKVEKKPD